MIKSTPTIVGYLKGEPIYEVHDMAPNANGSSPSSGPEALSLPQLFADLIGPIERFEVYFHTLKAPLEQLIEKEAAMGIPATPASPERFALHQRIALASTAISYLKSLVNAAQILLLQMQHNDRE